MGRADAGTLRQAGWEQRGIGAMGAHCQSLKGGGGRDKIERGRGWRKRKREAAEE